VFLEHQLEYCFLWLIPLSYDELVQIVPSFLHVVSQSTFFFTNFKGRGGDGGGESLDEVRTIFFIPCGKVSSSTSHTLTPKMESFSWLLCQGVAASSLQMWQSLFPFFIPSFVKICLYPIMTFVLQVFSIAYKN